MQIQDFLELSKRVQIIIASKYVNLDTILKLYKMGFSDFGENQVQALVRKKTELLELRNLNLKGLNSKDLNSLNSKDLNLNALNLDENPIKWHFIGTLQKNKINLLLKQKPVLWQSCNSFELASAVSQRLDYTLDTLLEINSANEDSKSGLAPEVAVDEYLKIKENCTNLRLCGVMSIGATSADERLVAKSFERTFSIFESLQKHGASICSMGMSGDFKLALKCGSNMLRLGSVIFEALKNEMN